MRIALTIILLTFTTLITAQFQRVINESFDAAEATKLKVDLGGNVSYQEWEGMFVLLETKVVIENSNENMFKALLKSGRYKAKFEIDGDIASLTSSPKLREILKSNLGEIYERVYFKIYFPVGFKDHMGNVLTSTIEHSIEPGQ